MRILEKRVELCTHCHTCENECSRTWHKEENVQKSRIRVAEDNLVTCSQCGECINICQAKAIFRDKFGIVKINKDLCLSCFMCVGFCPESAMFMHADSPVPFKCVACGKCTKACPANALQIIQEIKQEEADE